MIAYTGCKCSYSLEHELPQAVGTTVKPEWMRAPMSCLVQPGLAVVFV